MPDTLKYKNTHTATSNTDLVSHTPDFGPIPILHLDDSAASKAEVIASSDTLKVDTSEVNKGLSYLLTTITQDNTTIKFKITKGSSIGSDDARFITPLKLASYTGFTGMQNNVISFSGPTGYAQRSGTSYARVSAFIFEGTTALGNITNIAANIWRNIATTVDVRVYDVTNTALIAELTGITSTSSANIEDLGSITNLPAGEALFEVQILRTGGGGGAMARIGAIIFKY